MDQALESFKTGIQGYTLYMYLKETGYVFYKFLNCKYRRGLPLPNTLLIKVRKCCSSCPCSLYLKLKKKKLISKFLSFMNTACMKRSIKGITGNKI
jgi:hypothetical protein